ncbi:hypothetical protein GYB22_00805 [bacterium]|nr:hypothetical protein [bacterium]
MKTIKFTSVLILVLLAHLSFAQLPKLAVVSFDANAKDIKEMSLTELIRIEISKHNRYEMVDRYEIAELLGKNDLNPAMCYSKTCLLRAGELLKVDWVLSGNVDHIGESLFIRLRMMNMSTGAVEKEVVKEFLYIPEKINTMISICTNNLLDVPNDKMIEQSLSNRESYESAVNNPYYQKLNLTGPRMGFAFFVGDQAKIMSKPEDQGGFDGYPAMFQMGYQFEQQYLNEGKWQALFEFLPMISGIDQGLLIPSFTVLNGLRNNTNGLEFAIGPTVSIARQARMFQDGNGDWQLANQVVNDGDYPEVYRMDSRGGARLVSNVIIAAGFTLKSGKLNIPINGFVVPSKHNLRFGFSFGFNARK